MAQSWLTPPINAPVTLSDMTFVESATGTGTITTAGYGLRFWNNYGMTVFAGNIVDNSAGRTTEIYAIGADPLTLSGTIDVKFFSVQNGDATGGTTLSGSNRLIGADTTLNVNSQLNLGGDETVFALTGTGMITTAPSSTLTLKEGSFNGVISGGDSFTLDKVSSGILYLYGANTFTGLTTIEAGQLNLASGGSLSSKNISIGAGASLVQDNSTAEQLSDQAAVQMGTGATWTLAGTERIQSLAGTGNIQVANGKSLYLQGTVGGTVFSGAIAGDGGLAIDGTVGRMTLSGDSTFNGPLNAFGGVLTITGSVATKTINIGELDNVVNPHGFLVLSGAGDHLANDAVVTITGKPGTSDAILQMNTDETVGQVSVLGGEIDGTGKLTATGGYYLKGGSAVSAKLGAGDIYVTGESVLNGTADAGSIIIGNTMGQTSRLTVNGANLLTAAPLVQLYSNGQLDLRGDQTIGGLLGTGGTVDLSSHTLTIEDVANSHSVYMGTIGGTGGLVKKGAGVFSTTGDLTYTGTTELQGGRFIVAGSLASTQVTVGDGAMLGVAKADGIGSGNGLAAATVLTINGGANGGVSFANIDDTIAELHGTSGTLGIMLSANDKSASLAVTKGEFGGTVSSTEGNCTLIKKGTAGDVLTLTGTGSDVFFTRVDGGTLRLAGGSLTSRITVGEDGVFEDTTANGALGVKSTLTLNAGHASIVKDTIVQIDGDGTLDVGDTLTTTRGNFSGVISGGALRVVREDSVDDTLTLSGASTYVNATTIEHGRLILSGSLRTAHLALDDDSYFEDVAGGLAATAQLSNNGGQVVLGADETIASFYNSGTLDGVGKVLTATGVAQLRAGSIINADLNASAASGLQIVGDTLLNGRSLGSLVLLNHDTTLTTGNGNGHLAATTALSLADNSKLSLGGNETLATIIDEASSRIVLGGNALTLTGDSMLLGTLTGTEGSRLGIAGGMVMLNGNGSAVGSAQIDSGMLRLVGGSLTSRIAVAAAGNFVDSTADGALGAGSALENHGHASIVKETFAQLDGDGALEVGDTLTAGRGTYSGVISGGALRVVGGAGDVLTLSGANTYVNATTLESGHLALSGSLQTAHLSLDAGSVFEDVAGGLAPTAQLTNNGGRVILGADETIASLYTSGTIDGAGKVLTATGVAELRAGSIINAALNASAASGLQIAGDTLLNGRSLGSVVSIGSGATLTTGSGNGHLAETTALTLGANGRLVLGGNELLTTVADAATSQIDLGSRTLALGGNSTIHGAITGTAASRLTVLGNLTADSSQLTSGVLDGSGTITAASFVNKAGSTVKGTLHFSGAFTDNGILAPGNSPGTIVIAGNYTEAGILQTELGGTAAGAYDQVRIGGTSTIGTGATLAVQTYSNVQPARGDVYQVIANASGNALRSSGTFAHVTFDADGVAGSGAAVENAAVLFDVNTGRVLATGLNAGGSTFSQLATKASQQSFVDSLFATAQVAPRQIDSATVPGFLAYTIVTSPTSANRAVESFTPTLYSTMAGVAALGDDALARFALGTDKRGGRTDGKATFYAGTFLQKGDAADESDLRRNDYYVGGEYAFSQTLAAGAFVSFADGKVRADFGRVDADGATGIAYVHKRLGDFTVSGAAGYGSLSHDLKRTTLLGEVTGSADSKTALAGLGVSYDGLRFGAVSVVPTAQLLYTRTKTDGFAETGATDALLNGGSTAKAFTGRLGTAVCWGTTLAGRPFSLEANVAVDHAFNDDQGVVDVQLAGYPTFGFHIENPENQKTAAVIGTGLGYGITERSTLSVGGEVRLGDQSRRQLNVAYRMTF